MLVKVSLVKLLNWAHMWVVVHGTVMTGSLHCQRLCMQTPSFPQDVVWTINKCDWVTLGQNESHNVNLYIKYYNLFIIR